MEVQKIYDNFNLSPEYSLQYVDYLIKCHCFNLVTFHPLVQEMKESTPFELAQYSFAHFGRRGWYGSFENTMALAGTQKYLFSNSV